MSKSLNRSEQERYRRNILLSEVREVGQLKIKESRVLIVGVGGLGCPVALYLASSGVGTIGLVDFDVVDISNLQRQMLYTEKDVGKKKVEVAKERLIAMNSSLTVNAICEKLDSVNIEKIILDYDIVVDATDNFDIRYIISDACIALKKAEIYGAIFEFYGQVTVLGKDGPCLRCLNPEPHMAGEMPDTKDVGVLGAIPGVVGALQGAEVLKCILGCGQPLKGRMVFIDILNMKFDEVELPKNPKCTVCGKNQ